MSAATKNHGLVKKDRIMKLCHQNQTELIHSLNLIHKCAFCVLGVSGHALISDIPVQFHYLAKDLIQKYHLVLEDQYKNLIVIFAVHV